MIEPLEAAAESTRLDNVHRILDAAERLFRHYGYAKTNVADIARDLGMSPANIYRFFSSKADIHQAIAQRMLDAGHEAVLAIARLPLSAEERLRQYGLQLHRMTVETMLDEEKVHEMVVVALDQQWPVIEGHISRLDDVVASIIRDGIAAGEFEEQDPIRAARCFGACMVTLCHPQMVAQCLQKPNRANADELIEFALRSLKKNR
ncbi:TetR/AcrR family transcriptional regulator [Agrobacterium sp. a22-2]|uniref:TetR family transcriptional regulator n=1 Tax=Agrobacterium sp. a22-2 TaxID=2283840 RepID=UPI00144787C2|nr:TetR family transcriptional regulator [Agrobacterium sp. a22-2]NKN34993.1 TetR/AcrR family transcriptional regulator [Agrobacterium sp. a22-2]